MTAYEKADALSLQFVGHCAGLCRASGDTFLQDFSFLVEWYEAAQAAQALALRERCWWLVKTYDALVDEVGGYLDQYQLKLAA